MDYSEGSFTHRNSRYSLEKLFHIVADRFPCLIEVDKLSWILDIVKTEDEFGRITCNSCRHGPENWHEQRIRNANVDFSVFVTMDRGKYFVLDGIHRLEKAGRLKLDFLPTILVTNEDLRQCTL